MYLANNQFTGRLPDMPEYVGDMSQILLNSNNFTGTIPATWEELYTPALRDVNTDRTFNNAQLRDNQLQGIIPVWFTSANGPTFDMGGNRWCHRDVLENGVDVGFDFKDLSEDDPKPFGFLVTTTVAEGATFTYDYNEKVHPTDEVQWYKDGVALTGETFPTLTINNFSASDEGTYTLRLTNDTGGVPNEAGGFPSTIESRTINLSLTDNTPE